LIPSPPATHPFPQKNKRYLVQPTYSTHKQKEKLGRQKQKTKKGTKKGAKKWGIILSNVTHHLFIACTKSDRSKKYIYLTKK
jgi:hypothetical protein